MYGPIIQSAVTSLTGTLTASAVHGVITKLLEAHYTAVPREKDAISQNLGEEFLTAPDDSDPRLQINELSAALAKLSREYLEGSALGWNSSLLQPVQALLKHVQYDALVQAEIARLRQSPDVSHAEEAVRTLLHAHVAIATPAERAALEAITGDLSAFGDKVKANAEALLPSMPEGSTLAQARITALRTICQSVLQAKTSPALQAPLSTLEAHLPDTYAVMLAEKLQAQAQASRADLDEARRQIKAQHETSEPSAQREAALASANALATIASLEAQIDALADELSTASLTEDSLRAELEDAELELENAQDDFARQFASEAQTHAEEIASLTEDFNRQLETLTDEGDRIGEVAGVAMEEARHLKKKLVEEREDWEQAIAQAENEAALARLQAQEADKRIAALTATKESQGATIGDLTRKLSALREELLYAKRAEQTARDALTTRTQLTSVDKGTSMSAANAEEEEDDVLAVSASMLPAHKMAASKSSATSATSRASSKKKKRIKKK